ncbi:MAG: hypothetical protein AB1641_17180 [Thermodesulfobacteriota bacterium]
MERAVWPWPEDLLPHRPGMLLLERIVSLDDRKVVAGAVTSAGWPLVDNGRISSLLCLELMAQTVGLIMGWNRRSKGRPRMGFLVGIKSASLHQPHLPTGRELVISAEVLSSHGGLGTFQARVLADREPLAEAVLQVYDPETAEFFPAGSSTE